MAHNGRATQCWANKFYELRQLLVSDELRIILDEFGLTSIKLLPSFL